MNKSEVLADEANVTDIKLLQQKVNNNSKLINDLTNKVVADYCKGLDELVYSLETLVKDFDHPPTVEMLEYYILNLPIQLYFSGEAQENLGIKTDVAKAVRQEKYNEIYKEVSGTIADKTAKSELDCQSETITHIIYDRAYKIVKEKMEAASKVLDSAKKVLSRRMAESQLANVDDSRFINRR